MGTRVRDHKAEYAAKKARQAAQAGHAGTPENGPDVVDVNIPPPPAAHSAPSSSSGSGKARTSDLEGAFTSGAGLISVLIAMWICRDLPPTEEADAWVDRLSLTPAEAKAIGKPIASLFNRSELAKYGSKVVAAEDWQELIVALASYGRRVYPYLRGNIKLEFVRTPQNVPTGNNNGHQPGGGAGPGGGPGPDLIVIGAQHAA